MAEPVAGGRRNKLDLAKEAVYQASLGLTPIDQVGLVVFDDTANWVLQLQPLPSMVEIERALGSFGIGGGTNIRPGIEQAALALASTDAKIKHVLLLTDGIAESNYSDLIAQMRASGITISTVAVGLDANPNLVDVANAGGGRSYRVTSIDEVPRIFLQETIIAAGRDIVEQPIEPQLGLSSPIIRSLGGLPPLYGYNGTEVREAALRRGAAALVLAHNHPNGNVEPSEHDKLLTRAIVLAADTVYLRVVDHFIVSAQETFSFRKAGLL